MFSFDAHQNGLNDHQISFFPPRQERGSLKPTLRSTLRPSPETTTWSTERRPLLKNHFFFPFLPFYAETSGLLKKSLDLDLYGYFPEWRKGKKKGRTRFLPFPNYLV